MTHKNLDAKLYFRLIPSLFISGIPIRNICQTFDCTQIGHFLSIFIQDFLFQDINQLLLTSCQKKKSRMFNISTFCLAMIVSFLDKSWKCVSIQYNTIQSTCRKKNIHLLKLHRYVKRLFLIHCFLIHFTMLQHYMRHSVSIKIYVQL